MPCAGCLRRRKKILAAVNAVKTAITVAKQSYKRDTADPVRPAINREIPAGAKVLDIRK